MKRKRPKGTYVVDEAMYVKGFEVYQKDRSTTAVKKALEVSWAVADKLINQGFEKQGFEAYASRLKRLQDKLDAAQEKSYLEEKRDQLKLLHKIGDFLSPQVQVLADMMKEKKSLVMDPETLIKSVVLVNKQIQELMAGDKAAEDMKRAREAGLSVEAYTQINELFFMKPIIDVQAIVEAGGEVDWNEIDRRIAAEIRMNALTAGPVKNLPEAGAEVEAESGTEQNGGGTDGKETVNNII